MCKNKSIDVLFIYFIVIIIQAFFVLFKITNVVDWSLVIVFLPLIVFYGIFTILVLGFILVSYIMKLIGKIK